MAGTKIKNPETQIPKTPQMNDRDFINDCLMTEKYLSSAYAVAVHEMSHQDLYRDVLSIYEESEKCQRELYNLMFKKGWYGLEAEDPQKLQKTYQQFQQYQTQQFPNGTLQ
ncbi:MAG TPA: spore coat protein [Sporolactobacillaceae bacterium]|nr:spore coat protein [Sporolactobacillaceae bacterium]